MERLTGMKLGMNPPFGKDEKYILVTGGAGFIGANLCRELLSRGERVYCLDSLYLSDDSNIKELYDNKNFRFINISIINPIVKEFVNVKAIYHLACPASPPRYQKNPIFTIKTCIHGTLNALEIAQNNRCPILFTSTSEIYGDPLVSPQSETYNGNVNTQCIRSCYDEGKRMAETILFEYNRLFTVDIKVVRIFNTYGPYMDPTDGRVVSNFICQCINNEDITIYGDGKQTRSLCYVTDLVEGLIKFMNSTEHGPINMGNPNELTIKDLAMKIKKLSNSKSGISYYPIPQGDPKIRCPDIYKAKTKLKWKPKIDLDKGLSLTIKYYKVLLHK